MKKLSNPSSNKILNLLAQSVFHERKTIFRSRRKFIQQSALSLLGISLAPSMLTSCRKPDDKEQNILDVAILGGGIAGLNCANHLLGSNLSFKVFEGSSRLGGRILTHYNDSMQLGIYPEFGGEFIDSDHEDMLNLAKEFNLELVDLIAEQESNGWVKDVFYFDERRISETEIIREFNIIAPQIAKDLDSLGPDYDSEDAILLDFLPLSQYLKNLNCAQWLKDLLVAAFVAEFGLDCDEQSTINLLDIIDTDTDEGFKVFGDSDERYRIPVGNLKIIEGLADKIGKERIFTDYYVTSVSEGSDGIYSITFKNKETIKARKVVCTIPFTVLRELELNLKGMSEIKRKCIDELGYGTNTKLVLAYEGQPWRSSLNNAMGYLFTQEICNGWDSSLVKTKDNPNGAYIAFFGGRLSQKLCDESFRNPASPPTHIWRTELPEERVNYFVTCLDKIFPGSKEKFLGKHVFVNWLEYPYVKASYTCYKTGQWTTIAGHEFTPVGNFFFAGEHCSPLFSGYMNGAAETGRLVAFNLLGKTAPVLN